ncbi:triphosphoribosyl-dephospho-CoA synthase [Halorubrum sp. AD140]|uniref:triphosphoribosyl-dephospho-CoA synthase n=1 Tax=Halorubrum sp. AD140 TaxID=3050073 RepID=UPI002ACCB608|nr:triphosphoribosyl-dephospho-CoA synthase [Halorubrum sp. AD140]MDZ5810440.1 triphosphoribosyl-dephospho-CoA synthase [Halorubrum sp. AD140]
MTRDDATGDVADDSPDGRGTDRDPVDDATLALLLEVAGTPKPGNVDRRRDLGDLRFESFLGGAVGAREGLELAGSGEASVGDAFERAVAGMADRAGTNTQFGCLLLLVPLLRATVAGDDPSADRPPSSLTPAAVDRVTRETTVDDAVAFYRAFEHVDVAVADPPAGATDLDVRRGSDAAPALRERAMTLRDVMAISARSDGSGDPDEVPDRNAQEWVGGFPRTFRAAEWIRTDTGPLTDRAARAFLGLLAAEPDTLVAATHGPETAREASARAAALLDGAGIGTDGLAVAADLDVAAVHGADLDAAEALATAFVDEGINPGTTADLTCAALYVALRRGAGVAP